MKTRLTVLISRFNLPKSKWKTEPLSAYEAWLDGRFELFRKYTLASYANLETRPDYWILWCDDRKVNVTDRLKALLGPFPEAVCVQYSDGHRCQDMMREFLTASFAAGKLPQELSTTRLDTDDLLARDFFTRLAEFQSGPEQDALVSLPGGALYDAVAQTFHYTSYFKSPFISLVEKSTDLRRLRTVYAAPHLQLEAERVVGIRSHAPMWATCYHGGNLSNTLRWNMRLFEIGPKRKLLRRFGLRDLAKQQGSIRAKPDS